MVCSVAASTTGAAASSSASDPEPQTRIEARKLSDGRVEFRLDIDGTKWHPTKRFFPYRTVATDTWLRSSPYTTDTAPALRIEARKLSDGRVEFRLDIDGTKWHPTKRFFPYRTVATDTWLRSSPYTTDTAPAPLSVTVDSPGWCLGSEGVLGPSGRYGFGSVDVTYEVRGGVGPYTITSPAAPGATHSAPSGAITVSCARGGIDLLTEDYSFLDNVVEAGPKTVRVDVTDSVGATAYAEIVVEVAENAYTTEYNDGIMCAGRTYVLGDPDPGQWVLVTLPPELYMRFSGLNPNGTAHFEEITTGSELVLDWHTGEELWRTIRSEEIEGAEEIIAAGCPESTN